MLYEKRFTSEENTEILRNLIPHLVQAMKRFNTTYNQVRKWLQSLHKHRRVRLLYQQRGRLDRDNRRLHKNNRTTEVNESNFKYYQHLINIWYKYRKKLEESKR